jgi:hypothetical protein
MPVYEKSLTAEYKNLQLQPDVLGTAAEWHDQGSEDRIPGFRRSKGLWFLELEPACVCPHFPVRLFLAVRIDANTRIRRVSTVVCQATLWGELDELDIALFQVDMETARAALTDALTSQARAELRWRRHPGQEVHLALTELQDLVGRPVSAAERLIQRFHLARNTAPFGEGIDYSSPGQPVEIHADVCGRITWVHFRPRKTDVVDEDGAARITRTTLREWFGGQAGEPSPERDTFVSDDRVSVVEYDAEGAVTLATVMSAEVAP